MVTHVHYLIVLVFFCLQRKVTSETAVLVFPAKIDCGFVVVVVVVVVWVRIPWTCDRSNWGVFCVDFPRPNGNKMVNLLRLDYNQVRNMKKTFPH